MAKTKEYVEAGSIHKDCGGIYRKNGSCSCNISPPCSVCTSVELICQKCDFVLEQEDYDYIPDRDILSTPPSKPVVKKSTECEKETDDGTKYYVEKYFDTYPDGVIKKNLTKSEAKAFVSMQERGDRMVGRGYKVVYYIKKEINGLTDLEHQEKIAKDGDVVCVDLTGGLND